MEVEKSNHSSGWTTVTSLVFGAFPLVAMIAPKGTVIVLAIAGLLSLYHLGWRALTPLRHIPAAAIFGCLIAWMAFRGIGDVSTLAIPIKVGMLVLLGVVVYAFLRTLTEGHFRRIIRAMAIGTALALMLLLIGGIAYELDPFLELPFVTLRSERKSIFSVGLIIAIALAPVIILALSKRKSQAIAFATLVILSLVIVESATAIMAAVCGALGYTLHHAFKRRGVIILASVCTLWAVTLPLAMPTMLDAIEVTIIEPSSQEKSVSTGVSGSAEHRYYIWRFAVENAKSKFLIGWGTDTSRVIPGGNTDIGNFRELLPLHPHNALLQAWLELGYIGLLLLSAVVALAFRQAVGDARTYGAYAGSLMVFFVVGNLSFGLWQSWWVASLVLTTTVTMAYAKQDTQY